MSVVNPILGTERPTQTAKEMVGEAGYNLTELSQQFIDNEEWKFLFGQLLEYGKEEVLLEKYHSILQRGLLANGSALPHGYRDWSKMSDMQKFPFVAALYDFLSSSIMLMGFSLEAQQTKRIQVGPAPAEGDQHE